MSAKETFRYKSDKFLKINEDVKSNEDVKISDVEIEQLKKKLCELLKEFHPDSPTLGADLMRVLGLSLTYAKGRVEAARREITLTISPKKLVSSLGHYFANEGRLVEDGCRNIMRKYYLATGEDPARVYCIKIPLKKHIKDKKGNLMALVKVGLSTEPGIRSGKLRKAWGLESLEEIFSAIPKDQSFLIGDEKSLRNSITDRGGCLLSSSEVQKLCPGKQIGSSEYAIIPLQTASDLTQAFKEKKQDVFCRISYELGNEQLESSLLIDWDNIPRTQSTKKSRGGSRGNSSPASTQSSKIAKSSQESTPSRVRFGPEGELQ
jgi:hypothetical protein